MLSFRRFALLLVAAAGMAAAQPALTTIQDILYRADGTRFNGTLFITWNAFQAGDTSNVATANLTLPVVNGVLQVQLVPTTTASAGAQYNVTYNSQGINQFTQVWSVPPSTVPLRVSAILVSQGTVIGPSPVTSSTQISDVSGLQNELAIRPQEGAGFAIGRAAVINTSGQIDGASGNLSDCVRVDGSSGPCGGAGGGGGVQPLFTDGEVPTGAANGLNSSFLLSRAPSPASSLNLYLNGLLMSQGIDYLLSGNTITFVPAAIPQTGDLLIASYRFGDPANPLGTLTPAQVICSSTGGSTSSTTSIALGTCTIPAGLLTTGDRIEVQFQYGHTGSSTGFTGEIHWGNATAISRTGAATETAFDGRLGFGLNAGMQSFDTQSWGTALSFAVTAGSATQNIGQSLTIAFFGSMAGTTVDTVNLNHFTVVRYPAQVNP